MRPLIIDDRAKAEVARVHAHAEANPYFPGQATPGDNPQFVAKLGTYRVVFTFTHADQMVYRDLSVSVPSSKLPNPAAVFMIADLFGLTGWDETRPSDPGKDWLIHHSRIEHCIRVAQPIAADVPAAAVN